MKIHIFLFILITGCSSMPSSNPSGKGDSVFNEINVTNKINKDTILRNGTPIWRVEMLKNGDEVLLIGDSINFIKNDYEKLIKALNSYNDVKVKFIKTQEDCIYVEIINNEYFTQNIGDTGAEWYLASLVYTLTESEKFKCVHINFREGDHGGVPGKKTRESFMYRIYKK